MSVSIFLAAALMGQSVLPLLTDRPATDTIDVAYTELSTGQPQAALRKLEAGGAAQSDDPATLINLGAAYARAGMAAKAVAAYRAAIASPVRYDLQLADGSWVDSRFAARQALNGMIVSRVATAR